MRSVELVISPGREHERGNGRDTPRQQAQYVERRFVRPVHVLEHEERRPRSAELLEQRS